MLRNARRISIILNIASYHPRLCQTVFFRRLTDVENKAITMARAVRHTNFETWAARSRLTVRSEPYWCAIGKGAHLGYYRGARGGSWLARLYVEGAYSKTAIGKADDTLDADGAEVLDYWQAQKKAREWFADQARRVHGVETGCRSLHRCHGHGRLSRVVSSAAQECGGGDGCHRCPYSPRTRTSRCGKVDDAVNPPVAREDRQFGAARARQGGREAEVSGRGYGR